MCLPVNSTNYLSVNWETTRKLSKQKGKITASGPGENSGGDNAESSA